jgi:arabinose-5-phosphate isomerase
LGAITKQDVVVAFSKGGHSVELNEFVSRAKRRAAAVVSVTADVCSPLGMLADIPVSLLTAEEADPGGMIAMGSTLAVAAWGDALAVTLMRLRGYSWATVLETHPNGAVGLRTALPPDLPPIATATPTATEQAR